MAWSLLETNGCISQMQDELCDCLICSVHGIRRMSVSTAPCTKATDLWQGYKLYLQRPHLVTWRYQTRINTTCALAKSSWCYKLCFISCFHFFKLLDHNIDMSDVLARLKSHQIESCSLESDQPPCNFTGVSWRLELFQSPSLCPVL